MSVRYKRSGRIDDLLLAQDSVANGRFKAISEYQVHPGLPKS